MKSESFFDTASALETIDQFLELHVANPKVVNYEEFQGIVRNEFSPLPQALATLIRTYGTYNNFHPCNRVTQFSEKTKQRKLVASIDHVGDKSQRELITISNRIDGVPILGTKFRQSVTFDEVFDGSFDVASSDVRFGEHFLFMPNQSDDSVRLTRFVQIAAPLVIRFASLVR